MDFGIAIPQVFAEGDIDPSMISEYMVKAEALGFHSAWVQERLYGGLPTLHSIVLLTFAAAVTSRIKLGGSVFLPALRGPIPFAKALASLDQLSRGRLIAGVGLGGNPRIFPAFGFSGPGRAKRFEECIVAIKELWTNDKVTFNGKFWQMDGVSTTPRPVQKPHPPIWFGAHSTAGIKRAIRLGDGWMAAGNTSVKQFKEELSLVRQFLEEEGRDPATFVTSKRVYVSVDEDKERASRRIQELFEAHYWSAARGLEVTIFGSAQECVEGLQEIVSTGIDLLILDSIPVDIEQLELLASEVVPHLQAV